MLPLDVSFICIELVKLNVISGWFVKPEEPPDNNGHFSPEHEAASLASQHCSLIE